MLAEFIEEDFRNYYETRESVKNEAAMGVPVTWLQNF